MAKSSRFWQLCLDKLEESFTTWWRKWDSVSIDDVGVGVTKTESSSMDSLFVVVAKPTIGEETLEQGLELFVPEEDLLADEYNVVIRPKARIAFPVFCDKNEDIFNF